jgi:hypothetical protein
VRAQPIFARLRFLIATAIALAIATSAAFSSKLSAEPLRDPRPDTVTRQEVWQAIVTDLDTRGLSQPQWPRVEDLDMPAALPALAGRRLRVLSACWDEGPRRTQFRLECGAPGECLPFLVYVGEGAGGDANVSAGAQAASCRLAQMPRLAPAVALKPAVRPGDRARAVFVANGLRMTASVTCLERGREGEVIRVRALDGHIFRARISGPALLEALPQ